MKFTLFYLIIAVCNISFCSMQRFEKNDKSCELVEQTLVIVKPEAVADKMTGKFIEEFEEKNLSLIGLRMEQLTHAEAEMFYSSHKKKAFYPDLVKYMTSGPVVIMVLEGKDAISKVRKLIGDTDPKTAEKGTLRAKYGQSVQKNAVHASDSVKSAKKEIKFFFKAENLFSPCARIVFKNQ